MPLNSYTLAEEVERQCKEILEANIKKSELGKGRVEESNKLKNTWIKEITKDIDQFYADFAKECDEIQAERISRHIAQNDGINDNTLLPLTENQKKKMFLETNKELFRIKLNVHDSQEKYGESGPQDSEKNLARVVWEPAFAQQRVSWTPAQASVVNESGEKLNEIFKDLGGIAPFEGIIGCSLYSGEARAAAEERDNSLEKVSPAKIFDKTFLHIKNRIFPNAYTGNSSESNRDTSAFMVLWNALSRQFVKNSKGDVAVYLSEGLIATSVYINSENQELREQLAKGGNRNIIYQMLTSEARQKVFDLTKQEDQLWEEFNTATTEKPTIKAKIDKIKGEKRNIHKTLSNWETIPFNDLKFMGMETTIRSLKGFANHWKEKRHTTREQLSLLERVIQLEIEKKPNASQDEISKRIQDKIVSGDITEDFYNILYDDKVDNEFDKRISDKSRCEELLAEKYREEFDRLRKEVYDRNEQSDTRNIPKLELAIIKQMESQEMADLLESRVVTAILNEAEEATRITVEKRIASFTPSVPINHLSLEQIESMDIEKFSDLSKNKIRVFPDSTKKILTENMAKILPRIYAASKSVEGALPMDSASLGRQHSEVQKQHRILSHWTAHKRGEQEGTSLEPSSQQPPEQSSKWYKKVKIEEDYVDKVSQEKPKGK